MKSHILSRLEYGSILAVGANKCYLDKLQKLINRSLRICLKMPLETRVYDLHVMAKILPLRVRRQITIAKLMYQTLITDKNDELQNTTRLCRVTRSSQVIVPKITTPKFGWFRKSIAFQGPTRWLKLPIDLKRAASYEEFSANIKTTYLELFLREGIV